MVKVIVQGHLYRAWPICHGDDKTETTPCLKYVTYLGHWLHLVELNHSFLSAIVVHCRLFKTIQDGSVI